MTGLGYEISPKIITEHMRSHGQLRRDPLTRVALIITSSDKITILSREIFHNFTLSSHKLLVGKIFVEWASIEWSLLSLVPVKNAR